MKLIVPIVEGHGEVDAVPELLRRIANELASTSVRVNPPYRVRASSFLGFGLEFTKAISLAAAKAKEDDGIVLILLDCEDDCPATLGPAIAEEAKRIRSDVRYLVCLAFREFETWFMHSAISLAGRYGLPSGLQPPPTPETLRDAKGWFGHQMTNGYKETTHQVAFTSVVDLRIAMRSSSFNRLAERVVTYLNSA